MTEADRAQFEARRQQQIKMISLCLGVVIFSIIAILLTEVLAFFIGLG